MIVKNGILALAAMQSEKFDLIVLDIMMPMMDGYKFLEEKRNREDNTPVLILSARNDNKSIQKALGLGAKDYVTKPFNSQVLRNKVDLFFNEL